MAHENSTMCCVPNCLGKRIRINRPQHFQFPTIDPNFEDLSRKRQDAWKIALRFSSTDPKYYSNLLICSMHFISGKCARLEDEDNTDWVPSQHLYLDDVYPEFEPQQSDSDHSLSELVPIEDRCIVKSCNHAIGKNACKLFTFPHATSNITLLDKWRQSLGIPDEIMLGKSAKICSCHFGSSIPIQLSKTKASRPYKPLLKALKCIVPVCQHASTQNRTACSFYSIPSTFKFKEKWRRLLRWPKAFDEKDARVCSCHFIAGDDSPAPVFYGVDDITDELPVVRRIVSTPLIGKPEELPPGVLRCIVPTCRHLSTSSKCDFLKIPQNSIIKEKWKKLLKSPADFDMKDARVCSCHFLQSRANLKLSKVGTTNNSPTKLRKIELPAPSQPMVKTKPSKPATKNVNLPQDLLEPCSVLNCYSKDMNITINYFAFPIKTPRMPESYQMIEEKRREAWLAQIPLKFPSAAIDTLLVCSEHFRYGKPADVLNYCHIDWVPTLSLIKEADCDVDPFIFNEFESHKPNMGEWLFGNAVVATAIPQNELSQVLQTGLQSEPITATKVDKPSTVPITAKVSDKVLYSKVKPKESCPLAVAIDMSGDLFDDNSPLDEAAPTGPLICDICQDSFDTYVDYHCHKFNSVLCNPIPGTCSVCCKFFSVRAYYENHFKNHAESRPYTCDVCNECDLKSTLSQLDHMRQHSDVKYFICDACGKTFLSHPELKTHNLAHLKAQKIREPNESRHFFCYICGKQAEWSKYKVHMLIHSGEKPYKCGECSKVFRSLSYLKTHQQTHDRRPRKCDICQKVFYWWTTFLKHTEAHPSTTGVPLQCPLCTKSFKQECTLKYHIKNHNRSTTEHVCFVCKQKFSTRIILQRHRAKEHPVSVENERKITRKTRPREETVSCDFCDRTFRSEYVLELHRKSHTSERLFTCNICNENLIGTEIQEREHRESHLPYTVEDYSDDTEIQQIEIVATEDCDVDLENTLQMDAILDPEYIGDIEITIDPNELTTDSTSEMYSLLNSSETCDNILYVTEEVPKDILSLEPNIEPIEVQQSNVNSVPKIIEKVFTCNHCPEQFSLLSLLQNHKTVKHNTKFRCMVCNSTVTDLENHRKTHIKCTVCRKLFKSQADLDCHIIIDH